MCALASRPALSASPSAESKETLDKEASLLNSDFTPPICLRGLSSSARNADNGFGEATPLLTKRTVLAGIVVALLTLALWPGLANAHNVSRRDASFVQSNRGAAVGPFLYLGAKHMVTGYDHLLFLVGVIFFLYRLKDIVTYVSLFTLGHSTTLLLGVFGKVHANSYLIDAVIALSVVYKAFDNMDGFKRFLGFQPNTKIAVLVFGLFHGFGLATKLQELSLSSSGLVINIISFNVGVEIGQILALSAVLIGLSYWRMQGGFLKHAFATNTALMTGGFILLSYQLAGYLTQ
jgi:HupE / UreJ protein